MDLSRNSSLYFIIGLTSIFFYHGRPLNGKLHRSGYGYEALNVDDDDDEEIPSQSKSKFHLLHPTTAPEVIEVVEDEEEVEETVIELLRLIKKKS